VLERLVATARHDSEQEIYRRVEPILTPGLAPALDELLVVAPCATAAPVKTLGQETRSVARIGDSIAKSALRGFAGITSRSQCSAPSSRRSSSRAIAGYVVFLGAPLALQTALALRQAIWRKR
jgi:hypothetical protein